jgi:hypothetical protein
VLCGQVDVCAIVVIFPHLEVVSRVLTSVDLGVNSIGTEGGIALADALKVNVALTNLNLRNNKLDVEAGKALAEALPVNTVLANLSVAYSDISGEAAQQLSRRRRSAASRSRCSRFGSISVRPRVLGCGVAGPVEWRELACAF